MEQKLHYTLGLEIGIDSIGWAVLQDNADTEPYKIEDLGVRIFDKAEVPKTGTSRASERRENRCTRRTTRRRRHRKERIKHLIISTGIMTIEELEQLFQNTGYTENVYQLRVDALDRLLTKEETVRVLIHFVQRRGFKSNSSATAAKNSENSVIKTAISQNREQLQSNHYRTFGEMLLKDNRFYIVQPDGTRIFVPHNKQGDYRATADRYMLAEELHQIFRCQRSFGAEWATREFENAYFAIWGSQRNFDAGPGGNSFSSGTQIEKMLGKCPFETGEYRAPAASYSMEYFRLLQDISKLRIVSTEGENRTLTEAEKQSYIQLVMTSQDATYCHLRRMLKLSDDMHFSALHYGDADTATVEKKPLNHMQFYHQMRTALEQVEEGTIETLSWEQKDEIARILTLYKSDDNRLICLRVAGIPEAYLSPLLDLSPTKAGHLSIKALRKLIPHLEKGEGYLDACNAEYGNHSRSQGTEKKVKLSLKDIDEITNPVVRRSVSQSIKLLNAIVRIYGPPDRVRVELSRELGKSFQERKELTKRIQNHEKENEALKIQIAEYTHSTTVTGQDIVKFKLYQEQNGICLYSGAKLDINRLFEAGYAVVDHIVPYSISYDDSYSNKVLVLASESQQKGNRIPYTYFGQDTERWSQFEALCNTQIRSYRKRKNLLLHSLSEAQINGFKQRNLTDTQYLSRVVYRLINDHLEFTGSIKSKQRTQVVNGAFTARIRKRLGIDRLCVGSDLHHAANAAVIACITLGMLQKITDYAMGMECVHTIADCFVDYETGELISEAEYEKKYPPEYPVPWEQFPAELEARLSNDPAQNIAALNLAAYSGTELLKPVLVSRMPNHKVTGEAHRETIRSGKVAGYTVSKVGLTELKLEKKTGEIKNYYRPNDDPLLYEALKTRLTAFHGNAREAFAVPFYKPKHNGEQGPRVNKVKLQEKSTLAVRTDRGIAENGRMVRVDVFYIKGKGYYYVPVYVADASRKELPNRAVVQGKPYAQWPVMDEKNFVFSMYAGDLIYIEGNSIELSATSTAMKVQKQVVNSGFFYFRRLGISTGSLTIETHDRKYEKQSLGGKNLLKLCKYQVDVLGNVSAVHLPEKRLTFR